MVKSENNETGSLPEEAGKRRGAPRGNQYARKHGFYSRVLDEAEQRDFERATGVEGFDDEIALLRVKIKSLVAHDPDNIALIMQAINTLARMVSARYSLSKKDKKGLKEAVGNVLRDVAMPLGIGIGSVIDKRVG